MRDIGPRRPTRCFCNSEWYNPQRAKGPSASGTRRLGLSRRGTRVDATLGKALLDMSTWGSRCSRSARPALRCAGDGQSLAQTARPGAQPAPPLQPQPASPLASPAPARLRARRPAGPGAGRDRAGMQPQRGCSPAGFEGNAGSAGRQLRCLCQNGGRCRLAGGDAADAPTEEKLGGRSAPTPHRADQPLGSTGFLRTRTPARAPRGPSGSPPHGLVSTSGFLCDPRHAPRRQRLPGERITCGSGGIADQEDSASHSAPLHLNATPAKFLEGTRPCRTSPTQNDQGTPTLLRCSATPPRVKIFSPTGQALPLRRRAEAHAVTAPRRRIAAADQRGHPRPSSPTSASPRQGLPMRINANLGYKLDNSANVARTRDRARQARRRPARRHRRAEGIEPRCRSAASSASAGHTASTSSRSTSAPGSCGRRSSPSWSTPRPAGEPQGWTFHPGRVAQGDSASAWPTSPLHASNPEGEGGTGYSAVPSRRRSPARHPFTRHSAACRRPPPRHRLSATSTFIEEVAPQARGRYTGPRVRYDTRRSRPGRPAARRPPPTTVAAPQSFARGFVHETGQGHAGRRGHRSIEGPRVRPRWPPGPTGAS